MAYNTEDLFNKAKEAIEKHKLFFIEDIVAFVPCDKTTFYRHFPLESNEYNKLKEMLDKNKIEIKTSMRSKWYKSDAPALQMALYKLAASPEEHKLLQMNYQDVTSGGKRILPKIEWENGDTSEL
jgi:hypothetical protein